MAVSPFRSEGADVVDSVGGESHEADETAHLLSTISSPTGAV
jgi:hypothetical protein